MGIVVDAETQERFAQGGESVGEVAYSENTGWFEL